MVKIKIQFQNWKVFIFIAILFFVPLSGCTENIRTNTDTNGIVLTPLEVTADPAAYTNDEIRVEGVIITKDQAACRFLIMPTNIYLGCGRNAFCGEENTHLTVDCKRYLSEVSIPSLEHAVVVTGNLEEAAPDTYVLIAESIDDKGLI